MIIKLLRSHVSILFLIAAPFISLKAQPPLCNGVIGPPILDLNFGQGNGNQAWYSPLSSYAPGLSTTTNFQSSGPLGGPNSSGVVKNSSVFGSASYWVSSNDHTGNPYGLFLGIDMPPNSGDTVVEYLISDLCPNTTLEFSIWLLNLTPNSYVTANPAIYQFPNITMNVLDPSNSILGEYTTGDIPSNETWNQYAFLFSNGSSSNIRLQIINNTIGSSNGSDIGLDDITIRPCVPHAFIVPQSDTTLCQSGTLTFTASITNGVYTSPNYQWQYSTTQGNTWINSGPVTANPAHSFDFSTPDAPAEYWIRYLVAPGNVGVTTNCHAVSDTSIVRIDTVAHNFLNPDDTMICANLTLHLDLSETNATVYYWNTGETGSTITIDTAGNYWAMITSLYGCEASDTLNVSTKQLNTPDLGKDTAFCEGSEYILDALGLGADYYLWNTGETDSIIRINTSGIYWVWAYFGDCISGDTIQVDFNPYPEVDLGSDVIICEGTAIELKSSVHSAGAAYLWNTGAITSEILAVDSGLYWLSLTGFPDCRGSDSIYVGMQKCVCDFLVPNAFSPNGDGLNDIFFPVPLYYGCPISEYAVRIFNRWGQEVFYSADPYEGWDGTINHTGADLDTYFYHIRYIETLTRKVKTYKGDLTLMR